MQNRNAADLLGILFAANCKPTGLFFGPGLVLAASLIRTRRKAASWIADIGIFLTLLGAYYFNANV